MVLVILLDEVLHDRARLEKVNLLTIGEVVGHGGDAAIWVDFEEPGLFLLVRREVELLDFVGQSVRLESGFNGAKRPRRNVPELFQSNRDLDSIWRLRCVQCNVRCSCHCLVTDLNCGRSAAFSTAFYIPSSGGLHNPDGMSPCTVTS